jgi:outer membrane protein assembly factor BamA
MSGYETGFLTLRSGLFAGVGLHLSAHTNIRPGEGVEAAWDSSPYSEYTRQHGFDPDSQTSAGASLNLLVDTRDNPINASKGWLASVSYRPFFEDVLGSDSAWQEVLFDVRTFAGVRKDSRQTVAFWLYGDFVAHGIAPYLTCRRSGWTRTAGQDADTARADSAESVSSTAKSSTAPR